MSDKTHAIGRKQFGSNGIVIAITVCGRGGYPGSKSGAGERTLVTDRGDHLPLHQLGKPPTCKNCLKHAPMKDWSV